MGPCRQVPAAKFSAVCRPTALSRLARRHLAIPISAALVASIGAAAPAVKNPNVILVMTDDQGYGDVACHGNPHLRTPHLDRFHAESVRLTNFHVSPTCSPTRGALLTGRHSNRVGTWHTIMGRSLLFADETTMADAFRANGFRTAMFGKWHLGENYPFRPQDRRFDESLTFGGGAIGNAQDFWGNDLFDDTYLRNGAPEQVRGYCTDVWFRQGIRFVERQRDHPFFLYLPTNAPHRPFVVPERYSRRHVESGIERPLAEFFGMIESIDENFGRLLDRIEDLGLSERTVVVFMTDHGSAMAGRSFNAGMRGGKGSENDGGHRVPFFIRWPAGGISGGRDVDELSAHIDVMPTLADLAGLRVPANSRFDGISLAALLQGGAIDRPDRTIVTDSQRVDMPVKWRKSAVMNGHWRLINGTELYDVATDRSQALDVAAQHRDVVERLRQAYEEWWTDWLPSRDRYAQIVLGSDQQNPTWLSTHDIHGEVVWLQSQVDAGRRAAGFWAVDVEQGGRFEVTLRRWPPEVDRAIAYRAPTTGTSPADVPVRAWEVDIAHLRIGTAEISLPVSREARSVRFRLDLEAGPARLQAWFSEGSDQESALGAYYVGVRRLPN